jgi:hypothetical protein
MTHEELVTEIMRLPLEQRRKLFEAIKRSLQDETRTPGQRSLVQDGLSLSQSLYGTLEFDSGPPTDEELKDHYADYLMEKYS